MDEKLIPLLDRITSALECITAGILNEEMLGGPHAPVLEPV